MTIREKFENYQPFNNQEIKDKEYFLKWCDTFKDILTRNNEFAHISCSAFVVNKERTKMLVVYHNIYDAWIYPGGHADGEDDFLRVAVREVEEETGLKVKVLSPDIFSIQALPTKGHIKKGKYVSAHTHLDIIYLLEADDTLPLRKKEDENQGVKWINFENAIDGNIVDFTRDINKKLIEKLKTIKFQ